MADGGDSATNGTASGGKDDKKTRKKTIRHGAWSKKRSKASELPSVERHSFFNIKRDGKIGQGNTHVSLIFPLSKQKVPFTRTQKAIVRRRSSRLNENDFDPLDIIALAPKSGYTHKREKRSGARRTLEAK